MGILKTSKPWIFENNMAAFIIIGTLFIYLFLELCLYNRRTLDWHGENSMLKVPGTYRAEFFSSFDVFYVIILLEGFFCLVLSLRLPTNAGILIFILSLLIICVPAFLFYNKYQYWQLNGNRSYTFDPILTKITIEGETTDQISFNEMKEIIFYCPINAKMVSGSYLKIIIENNPNPIYLTSLLPCYGILEEFFVGIKKRKINKRIFIVK